MRMRKRIAVIAAIVMTAVMSLESSIAATTVGIENGAAAVTVNATTVGFGGHEWWVIGDESSGVYKQASSVTLLSKNHNDDFGVMEFRKRSDTEQKGYKRYGGQWYEGEFGIPNDYKDSTLQRKMVSIGNGLPKKEAGKINSRTLTARDDVNYQITGGDVENQKLWSLSYNEWKGIGAARVKSYRDSFWFRSPSSEYISLTGRGDGGFFDTSNVNDSYAVRPALNLNLTSVIFTSNSVAGKSSATAGGGLVSVTNPVTTGDGNKIKYTFEDDELKLGNVYVSKIENNTVTVKYEGATAGKTLSIIVKNNSGAVTHYGKLAESIKADGEASFTLPDGYDSTKDKIELFAEEIGSENESDFASAPKALNINTVTVNGGKGGGLHAKDSEVMLTADAPAQGKRFVRWDVSPAVQLAQGTSLTDETIKFTMPDKPVTATAVYEDVYTVSVTGGTGGGEYAEGEKVTLTADAPAQGKYFWGWSITPQVTLIEGTLSSGIIKLKMPGENVTATAVYEDIPPVVYPIKDGGNSTWQQGDEGGLVITSDGEHRKFTGVSIDGAMLDSIHYTAESGSTVVTLKAGYLSTLSVGEHVLRIHFTDGYTETKFSIQEVQTDNPNPPTIDPGEPTPPVEPGEPNPPVQGGTTSTPTETAVAPADTSPKTGDSNLIWIIASIMAGAGIAFMTVGAVKKSKQI